MIAHTPAWRRFTSHRVTSLGLAVSGLASGGLAAGGIVATATPARTDHPHGDEHEQQERRAQGEQVAHDGIHSLNMGDGETGIKADRSWSPHDVPPGGYAGAIRGMGSGAFSISA